MSQPRLYKTEAIVLRASPLGEADRLLTLLTPGMGRVHVFARGVRRVTSKLGGHLDTLNRVTVGLARGHARDVVTSALALETFRPMRKDLEAMSMAVYAAELVDAFVPEEAPSPAVYSLLLETLRTLGATGDQQLAMRYFELRLLDESGFLPELDCCVVCRREVAPGHYAFDPVAGGLVCPGCAASVAIPASNEAIVSMRLLRDTHGTEARNGSLGKELRHELELLLAASVRAVLEQGTRTSSFLDHLRSLPKQQ